jgi:amidase
VALGRGRAGRRHPHAQGFEPLPAVSVPTGVWGGLPLGVQVIGGRYREDLCLDAAEVIEAQRGLPTPIDPVR